MQSCYYENNTKNVIEPPFEIPYNWQWSRLNDVAETQTGTTPSTEISDNFGSYIPFIKPADIINGEINYCNEGLSEKGILESRLIKENSILMVCIGGSLGKCALSKYDVSCNQQINTATPYTGILPEYLFLCLSSDYFYKTARSFATGTATPILNKSSWGNILIPIPPINEQVRIIKKTQNLLAVL